MKVLYVSEPMRAVDLLKPTNFARRMRLLPCDVVECVSPGDVHEHCNTADVILLNVYDCVPFWQEIKFIMQLPVLIGRVHMDPWHYKVRLRQDCDELDVRVSVTYEPLKRYRPEWSDLIFWSPHCVDVQDYNVPRDIDILFWGNPAQKYYPFRRFVNQSLKKLVVGDPVEIDPFLSVTTIKIGGSSYKYAFVRMDVEGHLWWVDGYYGPKLYELISRAKVCPTGTRGGVAVGKFFENAACGAVTLAEEFDDSEALNFKHGENIWFTDEQHFLEDLRYLLEHNSTVQRMSCNARELIRARHTPAVRAQELYKFLCEKQMGVE